MPRIDIVVETPVARTPRVMQLEGMFDCPAESKLSRAWRGDVDFDAKPWNVGLIVGPSGCGKSTILRGVFGQPQDLEWGLGAVIDDFASGLSMKSISETCASVGFNTIPSWMKPYSVLSNGERFRVELARRLLADANPIIVDEFTSVVDRQVAQIGAHAVQKYVRANGRRFVAASCHYDIVDWLQPDWILEPATMHFARRALQRRPAISIEIARVAHGAWPLFAPFHYMSADLHRSAACWGLWANGTLACFAALLHLPHPRVRDIKRVSRVVTMPDWQGVGLAFVLVDTLAAAHKSRGLRLHHYPAHPSFIRSMDRSPKWALVKRPGSFSRAPGAPSTRRSVQHSRPCAVFEYVGPASDSATADAILSTAETPA